MGEVNTMKLTAGEITGAVLAFIPGVSTISGLIKAFVYYNRAKKSGGNNEQMQATAQKTANESAKHFINVQPVCHKCEEKLWKASIVEMIPGVNILAAIYSATVLGDLSKARGVNDNEKSQREFLFKKYNIESLAEFGPNLARNKKKNEMICEIFFTLNDLGASQEIKKELAKSCWGEIVPYDDDFHPTLILNYIASKKAKLTQESNPVDNNRLEILANIYQTTHIKVLALKGIDVQKQWLALVNRKEVKFD